ncbi:hypothetical protein ACOSP7_028046 [Xanthoceras sorbifolium]
MESFRRELRDHLRMLTTLIMIIIAIMMTLNIQCVSAKLHRVGGKSGWTSNVNYIEWASQERFYVKDWLIFYFDKNMYNVLEVNKTNYENCRDQDFISNITRGGRDVFELLEARPYYFLSGRGFCWGGMKFAISVTQAPPPPAPAPASSKSASSASSSTTTITLLLVAFSIAFFGLGSLHII